MTCAQGLCFDARLSFIEIVSSFSSFFLFQLSKEMNASEAAMMEALPAALLSKKGDSVLSQGLGLLNDDLTLAEDIVVVSNSDFFSCCDLLYYAAFFCRNE